MVFLRAWYSIEPKKLYNPVTSLLLADKTGWQGMRLTGQIRRDEGINTPLDPNSAYRVSMRVEVWPIHHRHGVIHIVVLIIQPVERTTRRFNPLKVPRKLEASLPFASKTKSVQKQRNPTYLQSRAVVMEPEEKKAVALLQQIQALRKDKAARRKDKQEERKSEYRKTKGEGEERREEKIKKEKREMHRKEGVKRKRMEMSQDKGRGKKVRAEA